MSTATLNRRARLSRLVAAQAAKASSPAGTKLDITEIDLFPIREPVSHRAYSVVRVRTRGGLTGFGEGPPASEAEFKQTRQFWIGRPASSYVTVGPTQPLSGAMNIALLDIAGKSC